jgi:caa(3)-type oxidase subunit IV
MNVVQRPSIAGPFRPLVLAWIGLLILLAAEVCATRLFGWGNTAPFFGLLMAGIVAATFMHVGEGPGLIRMIAAVAVFWLIIILGLGSLDALTRMDYPVVMRTPVSP